MRPYDHQRSLRLVAVLGATAVAFGALGAHALKNQLELGNISAVQLSGYETGALYHLMHAIALTGITALRQRGDHRYLMVSFNLMVWGIICFSGSLYLLGIRELLGAPWLKMMGPVTPIGGLLLIAGWLALFMPAPVNQTKG